ncbi:MAG: helix-turn-helix domain-containing protein [Phycisphaerales bacterium]
MATSELMHHVRSMSAQEQGIVMAVTILADRIRRLTADERDDLLALCKEFIGASSDEERDAVVQTMLEIIDGSSSSIHAVDLAADNRPPSLVKWTDFVAKRVREAREAAKLTQEQLSERSGLPQSHISRIENAKLSPSRLTIEKIANALGKSVADFDFNDNANRNP